MTNEMKRTYNAIINNVQRSSTGKKINAVIPVDMIEADPLYQRVEGRNERKLHKLSTTWNDDLMDPIKVVPHPETYNFFVVDGLGRLTVAKEKGFDEIDCAIIYGPEDIEERRKYEAMIFLSQVGATDPVKPADQHNALVLINDPVAIAIQETCERYDVKIKGGKGMRDRKVLGSYNRTYRSVKSKGKDSLTFAFDVIKFSGYDAEPNGYNSSLVEALMFLNDGYKDVEPERVGAYLRNMSPNTLTGRAVAKYPERAATHKIPLLLFLQDFVTENCNIPAVFDERGKKVVELKTA